MSTPRRSDTRASIGLRILLFAYPKSLRRQWGPDIVRFLSRQRQEPRYNQGVFGTIRFYKDVLGLEEVRRHKSPRGSELVFLKAPESEELIELCHFPNSGSVEVQEDLTHLAFSVDSLEAFGRHLASLGLAWSDGPHVKEDGSGFAFIDAPEGYEIELMQAAQTA